MYMWESDFPMLPQDQTSVLKIDTCILQWKEIYKLVNVKCAIPGVHV